MDSLFIPVSLDEKDRYYEMWQQTPRRSIDYTLANLWGWQEYYGLEWRFDDKLCWIRQTKPEIIHWAPLGGWNAVDWPKVLPATFRDESRHFHRVPEELVEIWKKSMPEKVHAEDERGQWEYLYKQSELASLSGNRFHKKKNHLNSYIKTYGEPDYRVICDKIVQKVLAVQDDWCHWHECEDSSSLQAENYAINQVLRHWDSFRNFYGGCLFVDGKMIAFSVGEKLDDDTLGVHYEKGLSGFKGVYQAMNYEFARHAGEGFTWINRAQDLDEEGLRQAKLTYHPADYLRKYKVNITK